MKFTFFFIVLAGIFSILSSCSTPKELRTDHIPPVNQLDLNKYLGVWYEIARLPHSFEEGLEKVTATYSFKENGDIKVVNRGFDTESQEWDDANGTAWLPDKSKPAILKVSFFWPFAGLYKVIKLDENYQWAVITSDTKNYLWILARNPVIDESLYNELIGFVKNYGFDVSKIIKVKQ